MKPSLLFFKIVPFCSVLLLIMIGCSLRIGSYPLLPSLYLIPVYYWVVFRPEWLPLWSLFGIGLFYDALMGNELGFSSTLLMFSEVLGFYSRPYLSSFYFLLIWGGFGLFSFGYLLVYGLFLGFTWALFISWAYGVILYPILSWILNHIHLRLQSYV
jgi:rod shape-determining protein MreD